MRSGPCHDHAAAVAEADGTFDPVEHRQILQIGIDSAALPGGSARPPRRRNSSDELLSLPVQEYGSAESGIIQCPRQSRAEDR
jgi:hypothetical protein